MCKPCVQGSPRGEAGTSGFLSVSDSDRRVPAELGQESQASSCLQRQRESQLPPSLAVTLGNLHVSELQFHPCTGDNNAHGIGLARLSYSTRKTKCFVSTEAPHKRETPLNARLLAEGPLTPVPTPAPAMPSLSCSLQPGMALPCPQHPTTPPPTTPPGTAPRFPPFSLPPSSRNGHTDNFPQS